MNRLSLSLSSVLLAAVPAGGSPAAPWQDPPPHPQVTANPLHLRCRFVAGGEDRGIDTELAISDLTRGQDLGQSIELPAPHPPIRVRRYLPLATLEQTLLPDSSPAARPAVRVSIDGPALSYRRCLVAGDPLRNRMTSLIGIWRYMAVIGDEQRERGLSQFTEELTSAPSLLIAREGAQDFRPLEVREGAVHTLEDLGCVIRIQRFLPHYGRDDVTAQIRGLSDRRLNPAALLEIEAQEGKEARWVFAKFPDFRPSQSKALPYRAVLECGVETENNVPDLVLVTVDRTRHELWMRFGGEISTRALGLDEAIPVPGSQYAFRLSEFAPAARLVEEYKPARAQQGASTALEIQTLDSAGNPSTSWMEMGKEYTIRTSGGSVTMVFGPRRKPPAAVHGGQVR
ncbi:MAG: hypothetical protein AB1726_10305 [Planctomycetota bacterium]